MKNGSCGENSDDYVTPSVNTRNLELAILAQKAYKDISDMKMRNHAD